MKRVRVGARRRARALSVGAGVVCLALAAHAEAAPCSGRPTDSGGYQGHAYDAAVVKSYATTRLRVHYATTGIHAPNLATTRADAVPDTVALAADTGETALTKYAEMGFKTPPSDASCTSNGGDEKIDVYLVQFAGADGTTVPEACDGRSCSSFLLVDSTFSGRGYPSVADGFRTVVAHELFHAVQNVYDSELDRFWAEGTAQWGMKTVFPALTDFENQLPAFFKETERSLDTQPSGVTAGYLYGSAVWPLFLTLRHGPTTVREILEHEADGTKALAATDTTLAAKGSSIAEDYPLFGAWNAATKTLAGAGGYPDAAKYPGVKALALADGVTGITSGLGYFVYRGTLDGPSSVSLESDATRNGGVAVPIVGGKADLEHAVKLPANTEGEILVVVAGITTKKTDAPFTVHIGPPDEGIPPAQPAAGGGGDGGGCAVTTRASAAGDARSALFVGVAGIAGLVLARSRRRRRLRHLGPSLRP